MFHLFIHLLIYTFIHLLIFEFIERKSLFSYSLLHSLPSQLCAVLYQLFPLLHSLSHSIDVLGVISLQLMTFII